MSSLFQNPGWLGIIPDLFERDGGQRAMPYMADLTTIFHHLQRQLFPAFAAELGALSALDQRFCEVISLTELGCFTRRYEWCGNGAPPVHAGTPAISYLRGNKNIKTPLTFVRFEPYVVPKKSLTGDSAERVNTTALQVIFSFERGDLPIYVGQQMDVFIDTPEPTQNGSTTINKSGP
jgi:hypothetical protein